MVSAANLTIEFIGNNLPKISSVTVLLVINLREIVYRYFQ